MITPRILVQALDGSRVVAEATITEDGVGLGYTVAGISTRRVVQWHASNQVDALILAQRYVERTAKRRAGGA